MARSSDRIIAVINSTPLIALSLVERLDLLPRLFDEILIPTSVYDEVVGQGRGRPGAEAVARADWLIIRDPTDTNPFPAELLGLDRGEVDVILLAREVQADWTLIDEKLARRIALALKLPVKGTVGLLLIAYRLGLITYDEARGAVEQLSRSSIRVSDRLLRWFREELERGPIAGALSGDMLSASQIEEDLYGENREP